MFPTFLSKIPAVVQYFVLLSLSLSFWHTNPFSHTRKQDVTCLLTISHWLLTVLIFLSLFYHRWRHNTVITLHDSSGINAALCSSELKALQKRWALIETEGQRRCNEFADAAPPVDLQRTTGIMAVQHEQCRASPAGAAQAEQQPRTRPAATVEFESGARNIGELRWCRFADVLLKTFIIPPFC